MAVKEIVQDGDPVLREVAKEVPAESIDTQEIRDLIQDMRDTLEGVKDGVGLAAPQIGVSKRIFIVSQRIFKKEDEEYVPKPALVFINPTIEKLSKDTSRLEEGCLSVRGKFGYITRADKTSVRALDEHGNAFTYNGTGLLAEIFQHEVDHLNGIYYTSTLPLTYMTSQPETQVKFAFMGTPRFAVYVLEELEQQGLLPEVVFCAPDKPVGRKKVLTPPPTKTWAQERNIAVEQPKGKKELERLITSYDLDLSIVAAYNVILTDAVISYPKKGTLNVHPSLLPLHRGPAPLQQTILSGDTKTGVCVMQVDTEVDHGPILECTKRTLDGTETYLALEEELSKEGTGLLASLLPEWMSDTLKPTEQDHGRATHTHRFTSADAECDLENEDPVRIDRKVRALNPEPTAWAKVQTKSGEKRIKILSGSIVDEKYVPNRVIPEGKKEMSWDDFVRGNM